jgi:hypothetical protein
VISPPLRGRHPELAAAEVAADKEEEVQKQDVSKLNNIRNGLIAQSVELRTFNP